jgi:hypothetical protein
MSDKRPDWFVVGAEVQLNSGYDGRVKWAGTITEIKHDFIRVRKDDGKIWVVSL